MEWVAVVVVAVLLGLVPATIAQRRGHDFFVWWLLGAALFIVALPMALTLTENTESLDQRRLALGAGRKCPHCAEVIKREANVCRFCGRDVPPVHVPPPPAGDPRTLVLAQLSKRGGTIETLMADTGLPRSAVTETVKTLCREDAVWAYPYGVYGLSKTTKKTPNR